MIFGGWCTIEDNIIIPTSDIAYAEQLESQVMALGMNFLSVPAATGLKRFSEAGTEILEDTLKAFGDEARVAGDLPITLKDRGQRVIGRWWDTEVAEEFGESVFKPKLGASWKEVLDTNYAWLQDAIEQGEVFYLASPVNLTHLSSEQYGITVFARELDTLLQMGYQRVGNYLIPPH